MKNEVLKLHKFPLVLYVWGVISPVFATLLVVRDSFSVEILLFSLFVIVGTFFLINSYACKVKIYDDRFDISYFLFWNNSIEISYEDIANVDYKKGFFDYKAPLDNTYSFKLICYDTLILEIDSDIIEIHINTRFGGFDSLRKCILRSVDKPDSADL